jgi:hypothetical protein
LFLLSGFAFRSASLFYLLVLFRCILYADRLPRPLSIELYDFIKPFQEVLALPLIRFFSVHIDDYASDAFMVFKLFILDLILWLPQLFIELSLVVL